MKEKNNSKAQKVTNIWTYYNDLRKEKGLESDQAKKFEEDYLLDLQKDLCECQDNLPAGVVIKPREENDPKVEIEYSPSEESYWYG